MSEEASQRQVEGQTGRQAGRQAGKDLCIYSLCFEFLL